MEEITPTLFAATVLLVYSVYYLLLFQVVKLGRRKWYIYVKEQLVLLPLLLISPLYMTLVKVGYANLSWVMSSTHWYTVCMELGLVVYFWFAWQQGSMITRALEALDDLIYMNSGHTKGLILIELYCLPKIKRRNFGMTLSTLALSIPQGSISVIVFMVLQTIIYPLWRRHDRKKARFALSKSYPLWRRHQREKPFVWNKVTATKKSTTE